MRGMNARTGRAISGIQHIQQSITDILMTPIGSRIMRREYGSIVADLLDQPLNDTTLLQLYAATVMAIQQWENRIVIERVAMRINANKTGRATLALDVVRRDTGMRQRDSLGINLERGAT